MRLPDATPRLYRPHAWLLPYFIDWGPCGNKVQHARLYATVLRWFDRGDRDIALAHGELWIDEKRRIHSPQHLTNLGDLMASDVLISPYIPPGPFARWLIDLAHGDLITGGKTSDRIDPEIVAVLPGFAWALDRWRAHFPTAPFPYPFWIWPKWDTQTQEQAPDSQSHSAAT